MNTLVLTGKDVTISASRLKLTAKQDGKSIDFLPSIWDYDLIFCNALSGYVSFKALNWLSARKTEISFFHINGEPVYNMLPKYAETKPSIQVKQFQAFTNSIKRKKIADSFLDAKFNGCNNLLKSLGFDVISKSYSEAIFSKIYWERVRQRIRDYGYDFDTRKGVNRVLNRHATNLVNAVLNLSYGFVESRLLSEIAKAGLNRQISFLHSPTFQKHSLAYDLIEYLRPDVDKIILKMLSLNQVKEKDTRTVGSSYLMLRDPRPIIEKLDSLPFQKPVESLLTLL